MTMAFLYHSNDTRPPILTTSTHTKSQPILFITNFKKHGYIWREVLFNLHGGEESQRFHYDYHAVSSHGVFFVYGEDDEPWHEELSYM